MAAEARRTLRVRNPRTGEIDFHITPPTSDELASLCEKLRQRQRGWAQRPLAERIAAMSAWAGVIQKNAAAIAEADCTDTGYSQTSRASPHIVAMSIRGWCEDVAQILERAQVSGASPVMPTVQVRSQLTPYPLLGVISPWNAPLMMSLMDAVPALLAGCAAIIKPSEVTPRFVGPIRETIRAVPDLADVLTYVVGDGLTGQEIIENVDIVCFTGSVTNGRKVAEACARRFIPAFLELGGKDPVIVTASANVVEAARAIVRGAVYNTGQVCYSIERVYAHERIHDALVDALVQESQKVELNYPDKNTGHIGPFILDRQAAIVDQHLDDALTRGAQLRAGGKSFALGGGLYMRPTVLTHVSHDMKLMREETFGPVIPVMKYRTEEEAVRLANDTEFGLSAAVIAADAEEGERLARQIDAGGVSVQDTFLTFAKLRKIGTHSFKHSGLGGSRTGPESILRFLRRKAILVNTAKPEGITDPPRR
ncbi:MAG TPA: aldehyde dehydrogenase family protein [Steroidobacteraceae bacterium]|jgi:acyl-CoA reductase-like NAD-dependent aldehyde dehydrogenase